MFERLAQSACTAVQSALNSAVRRLPQRCVLCADAGGTDGLCVECDADLPWLPPGPCPVCALPSAHGTHGAHGTPCGRCLRRRPAFDGVVAAFHYAFPVDVMIRRLKFQGALSLAQTLGQLLARATHAQPLPDLLLPMPLAPGRLRQRGFNQAAEIARPLARHRGLTLDALACQRIRETPEQSGLGLAARRANLRGAFRCRAPLIGAAVAVVDDVMTSGATLDELARELKRAGARSVTGWVVARTPARADALSA